ncbi:MAG: sugar-binding protein [Planctomycetota bacterium]|jgi:hypothetical protein
MSPAPGIIKKTACVVLAVFIAISSAVFPSSKNNKSEAVNWTRKDEEILRKLWYKAPRPTITIPKISEIIKVDGIADEAAWKGATVINHFSACVGLDPKPPMRWGVDGTIVRNEARVAYDDKYLYIHYTAYEHLMPMLNKAHTRRDGSVWKDDVIELFFDIGRTRKSEYHVIINPAAAIYDALDTLVTPWPKDEIINPENAVDSSKSDRKWNFKDVQAAVKIHDDRWELEVKFDFASMGGTPKTGDTWGMDFCRQRRAASIEGISTYCSWSGSPYGFRGNMPSRGDVVFGDLGINADKLDRPFLGTSELGCQVTALQTDHTLNAHVKLINHYGESSVTPAVKVNVKKGQTAKIRVPYTVKTEGLHYAALVVKEDGKTVLTARRAFTVAPVQHQLAQVLPALQQLSEKAENPEFKASITAYRKSVEAVGKDVNAKLDKLADAPMNNANRKDWNKLMDRVKAVQSRTTYLVWTKNPLLASSNTDFPSTLADVQTVNLRVAVNEYEVKALNITNISNDYLNLIVRYPGRRIFKLGLFEVRSPAMTSMSKVLEENPRAFNFDIVRGFNLPGTAGEPLLKMGSLSEIVIPPAGTRQLLFFFHSKDIKPGSYSGLVQIYPLNKSYAPKEITFNMQVDDFEIPTIAELGVHVYNYGGTIVERQDMFDHKVNTWFTPDNGKMSIDKKTGKFVHDISGVVKKFKYDLKMFPGSRKGWAYGIVRSYYLWWKNQKPRPFNYMDAEYISGWKKVITDMVNAGQQAGLKPEEIMLMSWDEVKGRDIDITVEHLKILKKVAPRLKIAYTCQITGKDRDKLVPYIDIWNQSGGYAYGSERLLSKGGNLQASPGGFYDQRKDAGCLIWPYMCRIPVRGMDPLSYYRMYGWRAFDCQVDGISFFAWSYGVYRENNEVIPYRGWEAFRQGIEDWQYCNLAKKEIDRLRNAGRTKASDAGWKQLVAIFKGVMAEGIRPLDPERGSRIETARSQVADLILQLKKQK